MERSKWNIETQILINHAASGILTMSPKQVPQVQRVEGNFHKQLIAAWLLCAVFYFVQYALRSAPSVMVPELSAAWGLDALGLSSPARDVLLHLRGFRGFRRRDSRPLRREMDHSRRPCRSGHWNGPFRLGHRHGSADRQVVAGRGIGLLLRRGGLIWRPAVFPARYLATALGATQMFGMLGGAAGQFGVSPMIHGIMGWKDFWLYSGAIVAVLAIITFIATPSEDVPASKGAWHIAADVRTLQRSAVQSAVPISAVSAPACSFCRRQSGT